MTFLSSTPRSPSSLPTAPVMSSSGPPSGSGSSKSSKSKSSSSTPSGSGANARKSPTQWGPIRSLLALTPLIFSPLLALRYHYGMCFCASLVAFTCCVVVDKMVAFRLASSRCSFWFISSFGRPANSTRFLLLF